MITTVSFKIDENDKEQAQELFDSIGLPFSGAMNACLDTRSIPSSMKTPSMDQVIRSRIKDADNPSNLSQKFKDVDSLMESH